MKNFRIPAVVRLTVGGLVVLILGGLAGWYFYLHSQSQGASAIDAARGLGSSAPSFTGSTGSTPTNQAIATHAFGTNVYTSSATSSAQLWEVDATPVSGMGFVDTQTNEYLYYVERANGYVFQAHPSDQTTVRLTNTLMPKIYEAQFTDAGDVIERSIDSTGNVTTFLGTVSTSTASTGSGQATSTASVAQTSSASSSQQDTLVGAYAQPNILAVALNHKTGGLFYLVNDPRGGVDGWAMQWNGSKKRQVFASIIGSWQPTLLDDDTVVLLESPADGMPGYAYTLSATGLLVPLVRNIPGLTVLPKSASPLVIFGASSGGGLGLFARSTSTPTAIPINTIADKCVWLAGSSEIAYCAAPNGVAPQYFLNNWYRGVVHTSDDWWEIDLSTGETKRIYSPSVDNLSIDVSKPTIDATGNYIAFINATDQSLWVLHVAQ